MSSEFLALSIMRERIANSRSLREHKHNLDQGPVYFAPVCTLKSVMSPPSSSPLLLQIVRPERQRLPPRFQRFRAALHALFDASLGEFEVSDRTGNIGIGGEQRRIGPG